MFVIFPLEDLLQTPTISRCKSISAPSTPQTETGPNGPGLFVLPRQKPDSRDIFPGHFSPGDATEPEWKKSERSANRFWLSFLACDKSRRKDRFEARGIRSCPVTPDGPEASYFSPLVPNRSTMNPDCVLKDLMHPNHAETLKNHSAVTIKLLKTVSEFTQQLSTIQEQHAEQLQLLVETFRKKNAELRKERPSGTSTLFQAWETLLQEVEVDSALVAETANCLGRQVARPLLEATFYRKLEARKIFQQREALENALSKAAEQLDKSHGLYEEAYQKHLLSPNTLTLATYVEMHNNYVQDVHAANAMADQYYAIILPQLIEELEGVYSDLSCCLVTAIHQGSEAMAKQGEDMSKRYSGLVSQCKTVNASSDLNSFVRSVGPTLGAATQSVKFAFSPPRVPTNVPNADVQADPSLLLEDELIFDRLASFSLRTKHDSLKREVSELEAQIRQLVDCIETLKRIQQRSLEANLYNKANELQEEICIKRLDLRMTQLHLAALKAQRDLYGAKAENFTEGSSTLSRDKERDRKLSSSSSTNSMKTKWMKAFRSLATGTTASSSVTTNSTSGTTASGAANVTSTSGSAVATAASASMAAMSLSMGSKEDKGSRLYQAVMAVMALRKGTKDKRPGSDLSKFMLDSRHIFLENTYKKITPCDVCSQILRGHSRQGLKCRLCKINVHVDCKESVGRCVPKSRLLRRQKSTSEIETGVCEAPDEEANQEEVDQTYAVLKQAGEMSTTTGSNRRLAAVDAGPQQDCSSTNRRSSRPSNATIKNGNPNSLSVGPPPAFLSSSSAPHSPRRQKLNLRMKSFSLDESGEHFNGRHATRSSKANSAQGSSYSQSPSSPVHNRRLLSARNIRMNSVELPDENEKSQSSASASPCPSPKPHRLLPNNLYVVLFNFKARQADELDLKAGYKVTVIDSSDPDWWQGKCFGKVGFFPSKYVTKLTPGEKPLQVTHNIQIGDPDTGLRLLRDQIVIQIGDEQDGTVTVRSGDHKQGLCPVQYLQEV